MCVNRELIGTCGRAIKWDHPQPPCIPNPGVANRRPQIEYIMWGRRAAWSSLWWWPDLHLPLCDDRRRRVRRRRSSRIWGSCISWERFDLESPNFYRNLDNCRVCIHVGYDITNDFRSEVILKKKPSKVPTPASGVIYRERFRWWPRNLTGLSRTIGPIKLLKIDQAGQSRIIRPLFNLDSPNYARIYMRK